jgi:septal ring factor EnvC (AmiA/AmiB activator)
MPVTTKYLTQKDADVHRAQYTTRFGAVDDVSHIFGWASETAFFFTCDGWCEFLDAVFPDYFPFGTAQNLLISVVRFIYDNRSEHNYNCGVSSGLKIMGKITETIKWAQSQISNAVTDMRNRIDSEIVAPVRQKAAQIEQTLKDAQGKLASMGIDIDRFSSNIETMKSSIASFDGSIKAFDSKLGSFDSKLSGLGTTASGLQTQLRDAQAKLNQYKTLIDDVSRRVDSLENKQKEGFDFLKSIGWKTP